MSEQYEAFSNIKASDKFQERLYTVAGYYMHYSKQKSNNAFKKVHVNFTLLLVEEELCFLISLLTPAELEHFYETVDIKWSDNVLFDGNRPYMKATEDIKLINTKGEYNEN
ncbi:hypothetical protein MHH42_32040 [Bacillus sp. FSL L8-0099]|uniref:hypothetical protein n=1 Tax=unclassified Bacillus (in: firmicutes) TaxID=185979 RepID=UPI0030F77FEE